jgi:hypothetical protein
MPTGYIVMQPTGTAETVAETPRVLAEPAPQSKQAAPDVGKEPTAGVSVALSPDGSTSEIVQRALAELDRAMMAQPTGELTGRQTSDLRKPTGSIVVPSARRAVKAPTAGFVTACPGV